MAHATKTKEDLNPTVRPRLTRSLGRATRAHHARLECAVVRCESSGQDQLVASRDIVAGETVFTDEPIFESSTSIGGMYHTFLSLRTTQLKVLRALSVNIPYLSEQEKQSVQAICASSDRNYRGLLWFICLMKNYGHGMSTRTDRWAIYPLALLTPHSCDPNVLYRSSEKNLTYVAIKSIKKGSPLLMTYVDLLYASTTFRQERLLQRKLFHCSCSRCLDGIDPSRRVWCPQCRNDMTAGKTIPIPPFTIRVRDGWHCPNCEVTFAENMVPLAVEAALQKILARLQTAFVKPNPDTWLQYLKYLEQTAMGVLGPLHWMVAACQQLYSRYYAGLWYGGQQTQENKDLAISHANKHFAYVEAACPPAIDVDVVPWASTLMRIALFTGDVAEFVALSSKYLSRLRLLYGKTDSTIRAYESAIVYLANQSKSPGASDLTQLQYFAESSRRANTKVSQVDVQSESVWEEKELSQKVSSVDVTKWRVRPWENISEWDSVKLDPSVPGGDVQQSTTHPPYVLSPTTKPTSTPISAASLIRQNVDSRKSTLSQVPRSPSQILIDAESSQPLKSARHRRKHYSSHQKEMHSPQVHSHHHQTSPSTVSQSRLGDVAAHRVADNAAAPLPSTRKDKRGPSQPVTGLKKSEWFGTTGSMEELVKGLVSHEQSLFLGDGDRQRGQNIDDEVIEQIAIDIHNTLTERIRKELKLSRESRHQSLSSKDGRRSRRRHSSPSGERLRSRKVGTIGVSSDNGKPHRKSDKPRRHNTRPQSSIHPNSSTLPALPLVQQRIISPSENRHDDVLPKSARNTEVEPRVSHRRQYNQLDSSTTIQYHPQLNMYPMSPYPYYTAVSMQYASTWGMDPKRSNSSKRRN